MKHISNLLLLAALATLMACGDEYNEYNINGGKATKIDTDERQSVGPEVAKYRLEFPALASSNSKVIVHTAVINSKTGKEDVNYSLEWDTQKKATRWVCYQMYEESNASNWNRKDWPNGDPWAYDPDVATADQQATYSELSKSYFPGSTSDYYDKGHILPSADRLGSQEANGQTFYMTNIYPMVSKFNQGIWANFEDKVRSWAKQVDTLYVVRGGTIDDIIGYTINNHVVPKYFYMALLGKTNSTGKLKAIGIWIEHKNETVSGSKYKDYIVNIRTLENKTKLDFFCNLPNDVENEVETATMEKMTTDWGLN